MWHKINLGSTLFKFLLLSITSFILTACDNSLDNTVEQYEPFLELNPSSIENDSGSTAKYQISVAKTSSTLQSLQVFPSGKDAETKFKIKVSGDLLNKFLRYHSLTLSYSQGSVGIVSNRWFLGIADVTGGKWDLIDGVLAKSENVRIRDSGWMDITFAFTNLIKTGVSTGKDYEFYLSFFHEDAQQRKIPLTAPFFIEELSGAYYLGQKLPSSNENSFVLFDDPSKLSADGGTTPSLALSTSEVFKRAKSIQITPSGNDTETKIKSKINSAKIDEFAANNYQKLSLSIKIENTSSNSIIPNAYFLGLADTTSGFDWIDGMSVQTTTPLGNGWQQVVFSLSDTIKNRFTSDKGKNKTYSFFLSFYFEGESGNNKAKINLNTPFYIEELKATN